MEIRIPVRDQAELINRLANVMGFHKKNLEIMNALLCRYNCIGSFSGSISKIHRDGGWLDYNTVRYAILKMIEYGVLHRNGNLFKIDDHIRGKGPWELKITVLKTEFQSEVTELLIPATVDCNDAPLQAKRSEAIINPRYKHLVVDKSLFD